VSGKTDTPAEMRVVEMQAGKEVAGEKENGTDDATTEDKMTDHHDATEIFSMTAEDREVDMVVGMVVGEVEKGEEVVMMEGLPHNKEPKVLHHHLRKENPHQI